MTLDGSGSGLDMPEVSYPGGAEAMISHWEARRAPLNCHPGEALPALDVDLAALAAQRLPETQPDLATPASGFAIKRHGLAVELAGRSELALLNALLIAHLRKRQFPRQAPALFLRIWAEHPAGLIAELPMRWLISSAITFADHGASEADRRVGQSINLLFSLMKLYESERQYSGVPPAVAHRLRARVKAPLPMGMPEFALLTGGLDINLLAPIWRDAQSAPVLAPLACHLLEALNRDPGTLFRRLQSMRRTKRARLARGGSGSGAGSGTGTGTGPSTGTGT